MPPKKPTKVKKKPKKTKPKTTTKQKQSQKQIVNQIVQVYLDERKKGKRTRRTPQKRNVSKDRQNISISPILSSPLNEMFPYRQPNTNPFSDLLNNLNAIVNKKTDQGNRLGSVQEQGELPTGEQIADRYENTIVPRNPLLEPRPIQEKFPSLEPTPEPVEPVEETKGEEPVEKVVGDIIDQMVDTVEQRGEEPVVSVERRDDYLEEFDDGELNQEEGPLTIIERIKGGELEEGYTEQEQREIRSTYILMRRQKNAGGMGRGAIPTTNKKFIEATEKMRRELRSDPLLQRGATRSETENLTTPQRTIDVRQAPTIAPSSSERDLKEGKQTKIKRKL